MKTSTPVNARNSTLCHKQINMPFPSRLKTVMAAVLLATSAVPAHAVLERVGPINNVPSVGGFPAWYQDTTGLTLEFCDPKNQLEVDGGWCLLLPGDVTVPEEFPSNFFDEHFYYAADALMTAANGGKAVLVLAVEAAFATGPAIPGDQVVFARIRARLTDVPLSGTYRIIHPYGEEEIDAVAGDRIFYTEDIGIAAAGDFNGALTSRLGPFLLPADTPGGPELAPVAGPSGLYLADPGRSGPVTGSTLPNFTDSSGASRNHNIFRIEGPSGSGLGGPGIDFIETTGFTLMGRIFTGTLAGRTEVGRASYARDATGQKVDVYANAFETIQARVPPNPKPTPVLPQLSFFDAPCVGTEDPLTGEILPPYSAPVGAVQTPMLGDGSHFWGQAQPAALPATVCVLDNAPRDAFGNLVPVYVPKPVTDQVTITQASYDLVAQTLSVAAASSDTSVPPTLTVAFGTHLVDLAAGKASITPLAAPPSKVTVRSSAQGSSDYLVSTGTTPVFGSTPLLSGMDGTAYDYSITASDVDGGPLVFTLDQAPAGMTISAAGAFGAAIAWTPTTAQVGTQAVTVRATDPTGMFKTQSWSIDVEPSAVPNTAPVVANDTYTMIKGMTLSIAAPGVLANDSDADAGDTLTVTTWNQPGAGGTLVGNLDGSFSYTPPSAFTGLTSFSYLPRDNHGMASPTAGFAAIAVRANRAPTTVQDTVSTVIDTPLVIDVLGNDSDPDTVIDATNQINPQTVFIPVGKQPDHGGTATVNANGTITYTPAPGFTGIETFQYAVRDTYLTPAISKAAVVSVTVQ